MRSKVIFVALLALVSAAQARVVTQSEAAGAVRAWIGSGDALGVRFGAAVEPSGVRTFTVTNGVMFHAVPVSGGGTVFTSADTEAEPIVAFTPGYSADLDPKSPLYDLLCRDALLRAHIASALSAAAQAATSTSNSSTSATSATFVKPQAESQAARKWAALLDASASAGAAPAADKSAATSAAPPIQSVAVISDLRVAPLVETLWSQEESAGKECYNIFTPSNYPCGCTATAAAQIMRHFRYPDALSEVKTFNCTVDGKTESLSTVSAEGGPAAYDWANMVATPTSDAECSAVGHLTYDVAIALKSMFSKSATSAYPHDTAILYTSTFGYANAFVYWDGTSFSTGVGGLHNATLRNRVIYPNLDAGRPVQLGIYGYPKINGEIQQDDRYWAGHSVVADGYGFTAVDGAETAYVHVNLGWGGIDNAWYNIPEIDTAVAGAASGDASGFDFLYLGSATFNISTNAAEAGLEILSGRVTDDDGIAVANALVTAYTNDVEAATAHTGANGIYAFHLPGGVSYAFSAMSADGRLIGDLDNSIELVKTVGNAEGVVATPGSAGNYWGADIVIFDPTVRRERDSKEFSSLAKALKTAEDDDKFFILKPTLLNADCTVTGKNITISALPAIDPATVPITRVGGARLNVSSNAASLKLERVMFAAGPSNVVTVADGGCLSLSGHVNFSVQYDQAAVWLMSTNAPSAANGLIVLGVVDPGFTLASAAARDAGQVFGTGIASGSYDFEQLTNSASLIANVADPTGEIRGAVRGGPTSYELYWKDVNVPVAAAAGYFIDSAGATNTAGRIDRLMDYYKAARDAGALGVRREMVILRDATLSRPLLVPDGLTLVGVGNPVLNVASTAGFSVTGGKMAVSGMTFTNYTGNALFMVDGLGAELDIGAGTVLSDIRGTNKWSGAVTVLKGSATAGGALFDNCRANGPVFPSNGNAYGGAVYLARQCALTLNDGCVITNCHAANYGGAIYALKEATVTLNGNIFVVGNTSGNGDDDIYLVNYSASDPTHAELIAASAVTGRVGVRWGGGGVEYGNNSSNLLATAASAVVAHASADAFFSDVNVDVVAEADDSVPGLRWTDAPVGPQPCDASVASARVTYANDGSVVYYLMLSEALEALEGDATVEIIGWGGNHLVKDIELKHAVTLKSDLEAGPYWIDRQGDCSIVIGVGASLTLKDVAFYGCVVTNTVSMLVDFQPHAVPLFNVAGGSLTLETPSAAQPGTQIASVRGAAARNAGAVSVGNGGTFTIKSGAVISDCVNSYVNNSSGAGRGGAVLVDDGVANLFGGTVTNCSANNGGGVFIGNNARVNVSGDMVIDGNYRLDGVTPHNLVVYDTGSMQLSGKLTGHVGYTEGVAGNTNTFGRVADGFSGSSADMLASAHNFTHDTNGDIGMALAASGTNLLVWSSALAANGTYTENGTVYALVGGAMSAVAPPSAIALTYNGTEQVGVSGGVGYTIAENTGVTAGTYTATATLRPGFEWSDGSTGPKTISWSIAKAIYDMSGVVFNSATLVYNEKYHSIEISGSLPDGVTVAYANNSQIDEGTYTATASFTGDAVNYQAIPDMTAILLILAADAPIPPPDSTVQTNTPGPIAFKSITRVSDGEWRLVVTNRTPLCDYRLIYTGDLTLGFTTTGVWNRAAADATPEWTTNVTTVGGAMFWKAEAKETVTTVE